MSDEEAKQIPPGIDIAFSAVATAYGEDTECKQFKLRHLCCREYRFDLQPSSLVAARWYRQIGRWLEASDSNPMPFQPNKARILPNGLASVPDGLALLKSGQVHAEKLVYVIAETPQLRG